MDIYCPRCGEPWEIDSLHDEAQSRYGIDYYLNGNDGMYHSPGSPRNPEYNSDEYGEVFKAVQQEFRSKGCGIAMRSAFTDGQRCALSPGRAGIAGALFDILGDDFDAVASEMEDAERMGLFD